MATHFLELATTLTYLGAKWLPQKKVNFTPRNFSLTHFHNLFSLVILKFTSNSDNLYLDQILIQEYCRVLVVKMSHQIASIYLFVFLAVERICFVNMYMCSDTWITPAAMSKVMDKLSSQC